MELLPMWMNPAEIMTDGAIAVMCDADRRPQNAMETLIIRIPDGQ